jgi:hypothetical protein
MTWTTTRRGYKTIIDMGAPNSAEVVGPHHEANAQLIAAAPDLLAACEAMAAQLGGGDSFTQWEDAKAQLSAAVAKAKGN